MGSKTKELFEVTFWAKKRVRAFTHLEARTMVEKMENISLEKGIDSKVTTNTKFEVLSDGLVMNIPTLITYLVGIVYVMAVIMGLKAVQNLDPNLELIGIFSLVTLIIVTIGCPNTVGRWFDFDRRRY